MSTSSAVSVPLILIGESSQRAIIFMIELLRGQTLSPVFMNSDIIARLVYEHITVEPIVVQRVNDGNTLLVFTEGENIDELGQKLLTIEVWLGHGVHTGCDVATPKQMMVGEGLRQVEREENVVGKGVSMQVL